MAASIDPSGSPPRPDDTEPSSAAPVICVLYSPPAPFPLSPHFPFPPSLLVTPRGANISLTLSSPRSCGSFPGRSPAHLAAARALGRAFAARGVRLVYGGGTVGVMGELARTLVALTGPRAVHGVIPAPLVRHERRLNATAGAASPAKNNDEHNSSAKDIPGDPSARQGGDDAAQAALQGTSAAGAGPRDGQPAAAQASAEDDGVVGPEHEATFGRTTVVADMHARKALMAREVLAGGPGSGFAALSGGYGTLEELMEIATWNVLGIHARGVCVFNVEGYWDGLLGWVRGAVDAGFVAPGNAGVIVEARSADEVVDRLREYEVARGRLGLDWSQK